ncbi:MAG: NAD(P)H-hydrate epimerase [Planctomycetes bacterium]|nr:NAD(P)H-hydrate epimerase [Planctomycetota bacterium]
MIPRSLSRDEVRDVDRRAVEEYGMPGIVLMENAGRGAAELLLSLGVSGTILICAGKGNNGGDGFVIARHLENRGMNVTVLLFADPDQLKGDALVNYGIAAKAGTPMSLLGDTFDVERLEKQFAEADWIVDALLGTGTCGEIREQYATIINGINASSAKVFAVDLPSGLDCDTGEPLDPCVRADHTATFVARKVGFERTVSQEWTGTVHVIDIGVPRGLLESL